MAKMKQIGMAAGTFSVALGIGFVMQNGDALASRFSADSTAAEQTPFVGDTPVAIEPQTASLEGVTEIVVPEDANAPVVTPDINVVTAPELETPEPEELAAVILPELNTTQEPQGAPVQLANLDPDSLASVDSAANADEVAAELDCVPEMTGAAGTGAAIKVMLNAPCHADTAFTVHHQGMMFTASTNAEGAASVTVPALSEVAVVIAAFEDGNGGVATVTVPDFANYDRAVLQWQGDTAVMLSAYEGDANFGDAGHIHAENPGDLARVTAGEGGYMMRLGNSDVADALMAEVYIFPSGMDVTVSDVMLVAEAEITDGNCGQDLSAQSIQVGPNGESSALDLTMTMPACDAVGDILILQNMFQDLTIAMR